MDMELENQWKFPRKEIFILDRELCIELLELIRGFGWVRYSKKKVMENDDPRRLYYEITSDGKEILVYELKKMETTLKRAKKLKLLGN